MKQGAVHTKKARKVCKVCNSGWMSRIVLAAKPHATKLIKGEEITLGEDEQLQVASWLALSALMADQLARSRHKFPNLDRAHMFNHHTPPPHWYIAVGLYCGPEGSACDQGPLPIFLEDTRTGDRSLQFMVHSVATIIGQLYSIVHAVTPRDHRLAGASVWQLHYPHLRPIWPRISPLPFPPPAEFAITGSFNPDGGLARDLSTRVRDFTQASVARSFRNAS